MSPELPIFERKVTRRQILWGLGSGVTTLFLSGCEGFLASSTKEIQLSPKSKESFPQRTKLSEIVPWKEEPPSSLKEIEKGVFLLGQLAYLTSEGKIFIQDLQNKGSLEFRLETKPASGCCTLSSSPDGKRLAVLSGSAPDGKFPPLSLFVLDLERRETKEICRGKERFYDPSLSWSPNGEFLIFQPIPVAVLSVTVMGSPVLKGPAMTVLRSQTGEIVYQEEKRVNVGGFSPNSQWVVTEGLKGKSCCDLRAFNLKTKENFWVADGDPKEIVWCDEKSFVTSTGGTLRLFDLATRKEKTFLVGNVSFFRLVPGGKEVVFVGGKTAGVLDLESGGVRFFPFPSGVRFNEFGPSTLSSSKEFIFTSQSEKTKQFEIYTLNLETGGFSLRKKIKYEEGMTLEKFLGPDWLLTGTTGYPPIPRKWFFLSLVSDQKFSLGETSAVFPAEIAATFLSEGEWFKSSPSGQEFYFSQGRKYPISSNVMRGLLCLSETAQSVPARISEQVPESLNKLEFKGGDLLSVEGGKAWYLREGKRYEIDDTSRFIRNSRFDRRVYHVPAWLIKKIPAGEGIDRRKEFFIDWDNRIVETQPDGGLMILFIAGFDSSSESQRLTFAQIIEKLKKIGWRDSQILFPTYNVEMGTDSQGRKIIRPYFYTKEHSVRFPPTNRDLIRAYLERLKLLCPITRFILVGHSQGGDMAFNAAISHADAVCQVITINSPLKGVDRLLWENLPVDLEDLSFLRACELDTRCEAIRFYATVGNNPAFSQNTETSADWLKKWKVELFTFSAVNDPLIRTDRALLQNSDDQVDGEKVQLFWEAPEAKLWSAHSTLLGYDPFITQLARVIGPPS